MSLYPAWTLTKYSYCSPAPRIIKASQLAVTNKTKPTKPPPPHRTRAPSVESELSHLTSSDSDADYAAGEVGDDDEDDREQADNNGGLSGMAEADLQELMGREVSGHTAPNTCHPNGLPGRELRS